MRMSKDCDPLRTRGRCLLGCSSHEDVLLILIILFNASKLTNIYSKHNKHDVVPVKSLDSRLSTL